LETVLTAATRIAATTDRIRSIRPGEDEDEVEVGVVAALRETVADRTCWASALTVVVVMLPIVTLPGEAEAERTHRMLSDDAELGRTDAGVAEDYTGAAPRAVARSGEEEALAVGEHLVTTGGEVEAEASVDSLVTRGEEEAQTVREVLATTGVEGGGGGVDANAGDDGRGGGGGCSGGKVGDGWRGGGGEEDGDERERGEQ